MCNHLKLGGCVYIIILTFLSSSEPRNKVSEITLFTRQLPHWGLALPLPRPGPFVCQAPSRSLTHPGNILKMNQNENKAICIQVEKKKEARPWVQ